MAMAKAVLKAHQQQMQGPVMTVLKAQRTQALVMAIPMMKYLEEAELELKCIAFQDFDFTNPEGNDPCAIHGLPVGQGLALP